MLRATSPTSPLRGAESERIVARRPRDESFKRTAPIRNLVEGSAAARPPTRGWAFTDTPEARQSLVEKTRLVSVVLCLHVSAFQLIAAAPSLQEYEASGGVFFLAIAGLYLALGVVLVMEWRGSMIFGLALVAFSILIWILILASGQGGIGALSRIGWFLILSIAEAVVIASGVIVLRQIRRSPWTPAST
jgi:hypothetical protein